MIQGGQPVWAAYKLDEENRIEFVAVLSGTNIIADRIDFPASVNAHTAQVRTRLRYHGQHVEFVDWDRLEDMIRQRQCIAHQNRIRSAKPSSTRRRKENEWE